MRIPKQNASSPPSSRPAHSSYPVRGAQGTRKEQEGQVRMAASAALHVPSSGSICSSRLHTQFLSTPWKTLCPARPLSPTPLSTWWDPGHKTCPFLLLCFLGAEGHA